MDVNEAQAISRDGFDDTLTQTVYDAVPLVVKLKGMKRMIDKGGGKYWEWPIRISKFGKANAVDPRADIDYVAKETRTTVKDLARYYVVTGVIPWDKIRENKGKSQKVDIIADVTQEIKEDMDDRLGTDIYTANPNGRGITPLSTIVDATATYASLAYNDASIDTGSWNATENTATKLELWGDDSLSEQVNSATFGKNGPNFHLTTKDLKSTYESILESQKVYQVNAKVGDKQMADAGFDTVLFKGQTVVADPYCPAGYWYGLDTRVFDLFYDSEFWMKVTPWEKPSSAQEYAMKKNICAVIQLACHNRRVNFKFTALDHTLV